MQSAGSCQVGVRSPGPSRFDFSRKKATKPAEHAGDLLSALRQARSRNNYVTAGLKEWSTKHMNFQIQVAELEPSSNVRKNQDASECEGLKARSKGH
jgi:hypothetical protein